MGLDEVGAMGKDPCAVIAGGGGAVPCYHPHAN